MNSAVLFLERSAERFPERIAVTDGETELSYSQLRRAALTVSAGLAGSGAPVVVYLPKSAASVVCFMAALYAGRPYAPLDYACPGKRLEATLNNLAPCTVVTDEAGRRTVEALKITGVAVSGYEDLAAPVPGEPVLTDALADVTDTDPAYIMYTSGSTGVPKGVAVSHRGVIDYTEWLTGTFELDESSVLGLQSGFHFDNSVFDIYGSFAVGAKLVIIPEVLFMYPPKLMELLAETGVTCVFWVPTVMISVANSCALDGVELPALKTVVFAGEVMPNRALNVWRRALPGRVFANLYGPTEITVDCTCYIADRTFEDSEPLPIGKPCANSRVLLIKEDGSRAQAGEEGEICVLGSGLALGYWNAPELTERAFVQNPLNRVCHERMYRTGDMGYIAADGNIMYVGRRDSQFKLRGNRIEPGDIEAAAVCIDGVRNACAVFDGEEITLFLETDEELRLRPFNVELARLVPRYMLPKKLVCMRSLPLTPNRKLDRRELARIAAES